MEFHRPEPGPNASDRLKKAIERNRLKQERKAKREAARSAVKSRAIGSRSKLAQTIEVPPITPAMIAKREIPAEREIDTSINLEEVASARQAVTTVSDISFSENIRKAPKKAPGNLEYTTKKRATKRRKSTKKKKNEKGIGLFVKGMWIFCGFLFLRMIFSEGGATSYYEKKSYLQGIQDELSSFKHENKNLMDEIKKIKNDSTYQKKLIRDGLGFISKDEFLVLFSKKKN